ncbi:transcription initiation factor TFIID subunit A-domain-containing protein [Neocallimastix sp. 'constans']|jgi:histone H3/H4
MSDQNNSNHPRPIPPLPIPPYNQVSDVFSRLGQSQQFPISRSGANRIPTRPPLNRQRPMAPTTPQWPLRSGFPFVGQPLIQPSFQFPPDVINNSPQLMLFNQPRPNLAALYFQQMAQAQNSLAAAVAKQNVSSPIIKPLTTYPPASNLSSTSTNSPINKESPITKQNSHSSLVNSPESTNNSSTTPIAPATTATMATNSSTSATNSATTPVVTTSTITSGTSPLAAVPPNPLTPQNILAAATAALQPAVKPPTNPVVEAALAASNAVAASNITSPAFQQKLLPIAQHKRKTLPITNPSTIVSPQITSPATFLQQRPGLINPANPLLQPLRPVVDPHLLVPTTTSHIPPEFDNGIDDTVLLSKRKIQELVSRIDPNERLDNDVEELIMEITQQFVKEVTEFSCKLAKHRKSNLLETKDLILGLNMKHNIQVPGFVDSIKPINKKIMTQRHQQKVLMVRKAIRDKSLGIRKTVSFKDHEGRKYNKHKNNDKNNDNNNNNNNSNNTTNNGNTTTNTVNTNNNNNNDTNDNPTNNENKPNNSNEKNENSNIKTEK